MSDVLTEPATVADIAAAFGVGERTVQNWITGGCPVIQRGRRGRGGAALLDLDAVAAWRGSQHDHSDDTAVVLEIASLLPAVLAEACAEAAARADGTHKRDLHGALAATWYLATTRTLQALCEKYPAAAHLLQGPVARPAQIHRMIQVWEQS